MSRYKVKKEVTVHPDNTRETQYAVLDILEGRVIVRYAKKKDADSLVLKYEAAKSDDG